MEGTFVAVYHGPDGKYRGFICKGEPRAVGIHKYMEYAPSDIEQKARNDGYKVFYLNGPMTYRNDKKALADISLQELALHIGVEFDVIPKLIIENDSDLLHLKNLIMGFLNDRK